MWLHFCSPSLHIIHLNSQQRVQTCRPRRVQVKDHQFRPLLVQAKGHQFRRPRRWVSVVYIMCWVCMYWHFEGYLNTWYSYCLLSYHYSHHRVLANRLQKLLLIQLTRLRDRRPRRWDHFCFVYLHWNFEDTSTLTFLFIIVVCLIQPTSSPSKGPSVSPSSSPTEVPTSSPSKAVSFYYVCCKKKSCTIEIYLLIFFDLGYLITLTHTWYLLLSIFTTAVI